MMSKIIVADDQQLVRQGICSLLEQQADMEVVGQASDGTSVIRLVSKQQPDVVIMDVNISNIDSVEATRQIINETVTVKVIALSPYNNKLLVAEMFKAGASGFLLKQCAVEELVEAIRVVQKDQVYLSPRISSLMVDNLINHSPDSENNNDRNSSSLSEREYEVIRLLSEGKSTKEIALHIDMSVQTVDASRRQIMKKLNLESLAQLVKYAIREGLTGVKC